MAEVTLRGVKKSYGDIEVIHGVDCAIAVDHMTLVAYEEGLGTCWIGAFEPGPVKELLGIPEPVELVVLLTLGYPAQAGTFRGRKSLDEVTCYERYTPDPGEGEK